MGLATSVLALFLAALPCQQDESAEAAAVEAAWKRLSHAEQKDAVKMLAERCEALETDQMRLVRALLASDPGPDSRLPRAKPPPFYDPDVHAEALPISRKELGEKDARLAAARKVFLAPVPERARRSAFRYDWGSRTIQRTEALSPEEVCLNAWNGYPPGLDRARWIALAAIDGGHESRSLAAFDHVYTDRAGLVYPGITLFDAWSSGTTMEMPDVDALGILHEVLNDWTTWVSPVPPREHDALYARIQELFEPARRYRELRETLADLLLVGKPAQPGTLWKTTTNLHAAWFSLEEDPARMARALPGAAGARTFVEGWVDACKLEDELYARAREREGGLDADGQAVRAVLLDVLRGLGALPDDAPAAAPEQGEPAPNGGGEPELDRVHQEAAPTPGDSDRGPR